MPAPPVKPPRGWAGGEINNPMQNYIISYTLFESIYSDEIQLHRLGLGTPPDQRYKSTPISWQRPDAKDQDRARVLVSSPNPVSKAVSMSKLITDKSKLIRRAKAVIKEADRVKPDLLEEIFAPFALRLRELGVAQDDVLGLLNQALFSA
jgi:hypothetical protein